MNTIYNSTDFTFDASKQTFIGELSDLGPMSEVPTVVSIRYRSIVYYFMRDGVEHRDGEVVKYVYTEPVLGRRLILFND